MAVAWTDITNAQVAAGASVTTALMTALRDNPEGIAQRASGAPKIFGVPYDHQEFTSSGTWTKPSNAESGDRVIVEVVGGGGSGQSGTAPASGGNGARYLRIIIDDIDELGATESVVVGAGAPGTGLVSSPTNGSTGGTSTFGTVGSPIYFRAPGGIGGGESSQAAATIFNDEENGSVANSELLLKAGDGGDAQVAVQQGGGWSLFAGRGSEGVYAVSELTGRAGYFPGGGSGAVARGGPAATASGDAADGVVRVWCVKEG